MIRKWEINKILEWKGKLLDSPTSDPYTQGYQYTCAYMNFSHVVLPSTNGKAGLLIPVCEFPLVFNSSGRINLCTPSNLSNFDADLSRSLKVKSNESFFWCLTMLTVTWHNSTPSLWWDMSLQNPSDLDFELRTSFNIKSNGEVGLPQYNSYWCLIVSTCSLTSHHSAVTAALTTLLQLTVY